MRYLTLITFLIIYTLVSPARAEYQSGYNPKEEYNCRYSWGSEKVFHKNNDGETVPLDYPHDLKIVSKEVKKLFSSANFNFKFAVNGDLIRTSKIEGKNPTVAFHEVIQNNNHVIVANHNKKEHPNIKKGIRSLHLLLFSKNTFNGFLILLGSNFFDLRTL